MRLLDNSHAYVIIGSADYIEIVRGPLALGEACERVGKLRTRRDQRYEIMEPRFCEHGCCILEDRRNYVYDGMWGKACKAKKKGKSLV